MAIPKTFKFNEQLQIGNVGEQLFLNDVLLGDGKKVELKSDSYSQKDSQNYFFEYHSDMSKGTLGGPWRSARDNVDYFCYLYLKDKVIYWFAPVLLVGFLDKEIQGMRPKIVRNRNYETSGFCVNREKVAHLVLRQDLLNL